MADETPATRILGDPQDPLPEANWLWRRVFTFACLAAAFIVAIGLAIALNRIVGNIVQRIDSMDARNVAQITVVAINAILRMFTLMFYVVIVIATYYFIAPSAEQITKMIQTAGLLKHGVQIATRAVAATPERREETAATIGLPPVAPVPPAREAQERDSAPAGAPVAPASPTPPADAPWMKKD